MIQLIVGSKGSGKTKKLIDQINASAKTTPVSYTHLDVYKRQV